MSRSSIPCSVATMAAHEPMVGSAPEAQAWLAVEQRGPYGSDALIGSHFPVEIGAQLLALLNKLPIKAVLIRTPGNHGDTGQNDPRKVWLARATPGDVGLVAVTVSDPAELLEFDFDALVGGDLSAVAPTSHFDTSPLLLVCTNAKRDLCCARHGRAIATKLDKDPQWQGRIWESSHLGGHRFAATAAQLPHGWVHGRLTPASALAVLARAGAGEVSLPSARGRSSLRPAAQVADFAVREKHGINGLDATRVSATGDPAEWVVQTPVGTFRQRIKATNGLARPESCGKDRVPWRSFVPV